MNKRDLAIFVICAAVLSMAKAANANTLWNDGFETGDFSQWDVATGVNVLPTLSTDAYGGTYSAQMQGGQVSGSSRWTSLQKSFGGEVSTATAVAYVKITQWSQAFADLGFGFVSPGNDPTLAIGGFHVWGVNGGYYSDAGGAQGSFDPQLPMNTWNKLKIEYSDSNGGVLKFSTNDILRLTINDFGMHVGEVWLVATGCCGPISYQVDNISYDIAYSNPIPEPATMLLCGAGLAAWAGTRLGKKKPLAQAEIRPVQGP